MFLSKLGDVWKSFQPWIFIPKTHHSKGSGRLKYKGLNFDMSENKLEQCHFFNPMGLMLGLLYSVKKNGTVLGPCHILVSLAKGVVRVYTHQTNTGLPAKQWESSSSRIFVLGLSFHKLSDSRPSLLISISHLKPASKNLFLHLQQKVSKKPGVL